MHWYLLPVEEQQLYLFLLKKVQRPSNLMAGVVTLNWMTFVDVSLVVQHACFLS